MRRGAEPGPRAGFPLGLPPDGGVGPEALFVTLRRGADDDETDSLHGMDSIVHPFAIQWESAAPPTSKL